MIGSCRFRPMASSPPIRSCLPPTRSCSLPRQYSTVQSWILFNLEFLKSWKGKQLLDPYRSWPSTLKGPGLQVPPGPPHPGAFTSKAIRTNKDVEGWHNDLNRHAQGTSQLPLYMLIMLLHEESRLTSLQIRLVSERKLCNVQRKTYRQLQ